MIGFFSCCICSIPRTTIVKQVETMHSSSEMQRYAEQVRNLERKRLYYEWADQLDETLCGWNCVDWDRAQQTSQKRYQQRRMKQPTFLQHKQKRSRKRNGHRQRKRKPKRQAASLGKVDLSDLC